MRDHQERYSRPLLPCLVAILLLLLSLGVDKVQAWSNAHVISAFSTTQSSQPQSPLSPISSSTSFRRRRRRRHQSLTVLFESSDDETPASAVSISKAEELKRSAEKMRLQAEEMEVKLIQDKLDIVIKKLDKLNKKIQNSKPEDQEKNMALVQEKIDLTQQVQLLEYRLDPHKEQPPEITDTDPQPQETAVTSAAAAAAEEKEKEEKENTSTPSTAAATSGVDIAEGEKITVQVNLEDNSIQFVKASETTTDDTNGTVANMTLDEVSEQEILDNFDKYADNFGKVVFTVGGNNETADGGGFQLLADDRDCLWQSKEEEYLGTLSEEDVQLLDEVEEKWQGLLQIFRASQDAKSKKKPWDAFRGDSSDKEETNQAEKEEDITASLVFANNTFAEARAGNVSRAELDVTKFLNSAVNFVQTNVPFFVDVAMNMVEGVTLEEEDPLYLERFNLYQEAYAMSIISLRRNRLEEGVETVFCDEVLDVNPKLFSRTAKPRQVGSAYVIEGKVIEEDGNKIVNGLKESLAKSSIKDKVNIFYLRDPSPQIELDEVQQADFIQTNGGEEDFGRALELMNGFEPPALLVTGTNLASDFPVDTRIGLSTFAFLNLVTTIGASYYPNTDPNYIQEFFAGIQSPILVYLLGTFAMQHVIQLLLALKGGFKIAPLPTLVPGLWGIPALGGAAKINSPPKNKNDMFDFGFLAPFVGFLVSYGFIVLGLESTMQMTNAAEMAQLPHFELDALKESFLTSATIESVMGTNVLLSLAGVSNSVPLDPMVIAGHLGLMINSIQLIPTLVDTNGGRAGIAAMGRFSVTYGGLVGLSLVFLLVQAYRGGSGTLDFVALLMSFRILFRPDIPCQNDVDNASTARQVALGISLILACLTLSPAA